MGDFSDIDLSDGEKDNLKRAPLSDRKSGKKVKECPGCSQMLANATKECMYCDYVFNSKSLLASVQSAAAESAFLRDRFPFEPERVSISEIISC